MAAQRHWLTCRSVICKRFPTENLDIMNRIALSLDPQDLYQKIVMRRRGGYCFELNALFGWLLRELGYTATDLVARFCAANRAEYAA